MGQFWRAPKPTIVYRRARAGNRSRKVARQMAALPTSREVDSLGTRAGKRPSFWRISRRCRRTKSESLRWSSCGGQFRLIPAPWMIPRSLTPPISCWQAPNLPKARDQAASRPLRVTGITRQLAAQHPVLQRGPNDNDGDAQPRRHPRPSRRQHRRGRDTEDYVP